MLYFVYILKCKDGSFYTGITTDLKRRFDEHKKGVGSYYTRSRGVIKIVYTEKRKDRSAASKREIQIKRLSREKKFELIRINRISLRKRS